MRARLCIELHDGELVVGCKPRHLDVEGYGIKVPP